MFIVDFLIKPNCVRTSYPSDLLNLVSKMHLIFGPFGCNIQISREGIFET